MNDCGKKVRVEAARSYFTDNMREAYYFLKEDLVGMSPEEIIEHVVRETKKQAQMVSGDVCVPCFFPDKVWVIVQRYRGV